MECTFCHQPITEVSYKKKGTQRYHKECYQKALLTEQRERQQAVSLSLKGESVFEYICQLYHIDTPPCSVKKQLTELLKQELTEDGILLSLKYYHEIEEKPLYPDPTLRIVPYVYDEAQKFYRSTKISNNYNSKREIKNKTTTVTINNPDSGLKPIIDINNL